MPLNESFEGYLKDLRKHWDKIVIEETDEPKDMDEDRRQCRYKGCEFPESNKASIRRHESSCKSKTVEERKKLNKKWKKNQIRLMYFIKTSHPVRNKDIDDNTYAVYKVGKSDSDSKSRLNQYLKNGTLRSEDDIVDTKSFIGIGVATTEKELLRSIKKDEKIIQRDDITSDNKTKTSRSIVKKHDKKEDTKSIHVFNKKDSINTPIKEATIIEIYDSDDEEYIPPPQKRKIITETSIQNENRDVLPKNALETNVNLEDNENNQNSFSYLMNSLIRKMSSLNLNDVKNKCFVCPQENVQNFTYNKTKRRKIS